MFIDIHVHPDFYEPLNADPGKEQFRHDQMNIHHNGTAPIAHVFNQMECAGLDRLCLLAGESSAPLDPSLVSNEEVRSLCNMHPNRFIGFASVDPRRENASETLEFAFSELKLAGLKLHPSRQQFDPSDPLMDPLYDICQKYDKPILFHSGVSWEPNTISWRARPLLFEELAAKRPSLRICLAHFGWPWVRETAMLLLKYKNLYADTALLYFDSALECYRQVFTLDIPFTWIDRSLRNQVMFGSNSPRFEQIRMADAITKLGFRDSTLALIRGQNAIEFLRMEL
ncbi:MAG: amidohydrolase family protein [Eubacteriales bacterium]|nr:amidohydrolase family protein [Eubacteriales bacterium]MDD3536695.1 amidohydrolase family protein [Eubacteriales bacterium]NLV70888.1 amidohydrolase [Clostridiales bacterium]